MCVNLLALIVDVVGQSVGWRTLLQEGVGDATVQLYSVAHPSSFLACWCCCSYILATQQSTPYTLQGVLSVHSRVLPFAQRKYEIGFLGHSTVLSSHLTCACCRAPTCSPGSPFQMNAVAHRDTIAQPRRVARRSGQVSSSMRRIHTYAILLSWKLQSPQECCWRCHGRCTDAVLSPLWIRGTLCSTEHAHRCPWPDRRVDPSSPRCGAASLLSQ